jgi:hypothetical protein
MKLMMLFKSMFSGTAEVYCVKCRATRKVIKVKILSDTTSRGIINRQIGQCKTCGSRTSTLVSRRALAG